MRDGEASVLNKSRIGRYQWGYQRRLQRRHGAVVLAERRLREQLWPADRADDGKGHKKDETIRSHGLPSFYKTRRINSVTNRTQAERFVRKPRSERGFALYRENQGNLNL
jgi:hypothetical protein